MKVRDGAKRAKSAGEPKNTKNKGKKPVRVGGGE